jgi:hypothetical protein
MAVPSWIADPDSWDTLHLGKWQLPGIASVKIKRSRKVDKKEGKDSGGATSTVKGPSVADLDIEILIWDPATIDDDMAALEDFLNENDPRNGVTSQPLDIAHPKAELRRVASILIEDIDGPDPKNQDAPGSGAWILKIKASEYSPAKKQAARTPNTSVSYTTATGRAGRDDPPAPNPVTPSSKGAPAPP